MVGLQARVISPAPLRESSAGVPQGHPSHQISLTATSIHSTTTGRSGSSSRTRGRSHTWTGPPATQAHEHVQG